MKAYVYRPNEAGLAAWPEGQLRLEGSVPVESAAEADVFVYPGAIHALGGSSLRRLPHWSTHEARHVFFHCADHETLYDTSAIVIRCNTRDWYFPRDPNTVSWPWPVEDFAEWVELPTGGFQFDVSFHGWRSSDVRMRSVDSIKVSRLSFSIAEYPDFCGYIYDTREGRRRRAAFRESMQLSRVSLCPESIPGVLPYRFFEAMSAGRVPFLVGSHYVLPQAHLIPYSEFCLFCPAESAGDAATTLADFLKKHDDAELIEMGRKARHYWYSFLHRDHWPSLMTEAVRQKLAL